MNKKDKCFRKISTLIILGLLFGNFSIYSTNEVSSKKSPLIISFNKVEYIHRWSEKDQHEFTPQGQDDLSKWSDMITINYYKHVKDGEGLALIANQVLSIYQQNNGKIIATNSVPRTDTKPAEYLIVTILGNKDLLEAVFARFKMNNGMGAGIIYSHRVYGENAGNEMSKWLENNGPILEPELMKLETIPSAFEVENDLSGNSDIRNLNS